MRSLLVIALALACATTGTQARLNETEQEFEARYGKPRATHDPTPGSDKTQSYSKNGVWIIAEFVKGRCQKIIYSFDGQKQLDIIFKAEGGPIWANYKGGGKRKFVRSDGKAMAIVDPDMEQMAPSRVTFALNLWEQAHQKAIKDKDTAKKAAEKNVTENLKKDF